MSDECTNGPIFDRTAESRLQPQACVIYASGINKLKIPASGPHHLTLQAKPSPARAHNPHSPEGRQLLPSNQLAVATTLQDAEPQVLPHQAKACQSSASEPSHPPVDSPAHWQHHPVQR